MSRDRGRHIRPRESYAALVEPFFAEVRTDLRDDLLRFPTATRS
jgi:hypothetical protein